MALQKTSNIYLVFSMTEGKRHW